MVLLVLRTSDKRRNTRRVLRATVCLSIEDTLEQFVSGDSQVFGDIAKNTCQGAESQGMMAWDGDVMLTLNRRSQSHVAAGLACLLVAHSAKNLGEVVSGKLARQPHTAMT
jgi:hypothetical protein